MEIANSRRCNWRIEARNAEEHQECGDPQANHSRGQAGRDALIGRRQRSVQGKHGGRHGCTVAAMLITRYGQ